MGNGMFVRRIQLEAPAQEVYRWHERPGALERLTPPWIKVRAHAQTGGLQDGARVALDVRRGAIAFRWLLEHQGCTPGHEFRDVQVRGPFSRWEHIRRFDPDGAAACFAQDRICYELPFGPLGGWAAGDFMQRELERVFLYRHRILKQDLAARRQYRRTSPLRILVSGSSGLIGSALVPFLTTAGHTVIRMVRSGTRGAEGTACWDPGTGWIETGKLEGLDAVIHLAGEGLGSLRWTEGKKERIRSSRIQGTRLLCETLARLPDPPKALLSASAIGYYGSRGGEILDEESPPGAGFLPELCREWEAATRPATECGIRVAHLRFGVVLSPAGGALQRLLVPFGLCLGGPLGSGWQHMSWIAMDDVVGAIYHVLMTDDLSGPVNVTGPYGSTNRDFVKALGTVLGRPCFCRVPAPVLTAVFGELADEVLLASAHVEPRRLIDSGYVFRYPDIEGALRHVLGRV